MVFLTRAEFQNTLSSGMPFTASAISSKRILALPADVFRSCLQNRRADDHSRALFDRVPCGTRKVSGGTRAPHKP